jgi:CubicO group peptidase (beta-lactamase class C family)
MATPQNAFAQASLDKILEPIRLEYKLPALAAAVTRGGKVIAAGAVGVRVHGGSDPVKLTDRFHLGSDTKAFTATLAGQLVDEGKLTWKSTIGEVFGKDVPGLNPKLAAVTLEQLLSHSSGLPSDNDELIKIYFSSENFDYTPTALRLRALEAMKNYEPKVPSPSPFQYSNFGYMMVGAMIEKVTGKPWEALITERLFAPLKLRTAGLGPQATVGKIDAPVGHKVEDGKITPVPWGPAADVPFLMGPAGNAHMSVLDFATWATWNAGGGKRKPALVKRETLATIHRPLVKTPENLRPRPGTPGSGEYGFGWGIAKFPWAPRPVLTHNGSNSMNLAKIVIDADKDLAIVVMTNYPGDAAEDGSQRVAEVLYRKYVKDY